MQEKTCTKCGTKKPVSEYSKLKSGRFGVRSACKQCTNEYNAKYRSENQELVKASTASWRAENKDHIREYNSRYHEANYTPKPKKPVRSKKDADRQYYNDNREAIIKRATDWNKDNREKSREHSRNTQKKRRLTAKGRIEDTMSSSLYQAVKGAKSGRRWETLVGYTVEELMAHLESLFLPGMTWENYGRGGWHIDHKIPRSAFNYETPDHIDFRRCWSLDNLQPLWERDNIVKGNRLERAFQPSLAI
ncbi:hypothetical protein ACFPOD_05075 [Nitratireductor kimnyeongensis]|uniref:HNH endonuclease n=1 Tax=Nitratireductor kimnyeongensis TaxID=430679 RepID=A0ABW0T6N9_9HYPH